MTKVILDFKPETPFGIHLYPYFEKVYNLVANRKASSFRFASSRTPLNTDREGKALIKRKRGFGRLSALE